MGNMRLADIMVTVVLSQNKYNRGHSTAMLAGLCAVIPRKALLLPSYSAVCKPWCYLFNALWLQIILEGFVVHRFCGE